MSDKFSPHSQKMSLAEENRALRDRLEVAEATIRAIRGGEVDALIVEEDNKTAVKHIVDDEILAQSILEQVADAVVICNEKGIILRASRAVNEMFDENPLQKPFDQVFTLYTPNRAEQKPLDFQSLVFSENLRGYEVTTRYGNDEFFLLLSVGLLRSDADSLLGAVITLTDITDRKRAEASLRQADRRKDEFLATLAHELRNPLAPLYNALNILKIGGNPVIMREAQSTMSRQLQQMVRLVDDLLDVSRISRNMIELRKERISFNTVIENALETAKPLIEAQHHRFIAELPAKTIYLDADLTRMAQIFANLLNNAAKYTPQGGSIHLLATMENEGLAVSIRDSGIGIERSMLPKIFEMFSQVDNSFERSHGGLGIGLSLVKNLLALHGGTIEARSAGIGEGSEFIVWLPVSVEAEAEAPQADEPETSARDGLRVLVVDDNVPSAKTMGWMLELMGHTAELIHDGEAVLSAAQQFRPDVVLLDIGLPGRSGYDVCRELRQHADFVSTTLIAQTGWGQEKDKRMAREAGFDHHLVKPVNAEVLGKILDTIDA